MNLPTITWARMTFASLSAARFYQLIAVFFATLFIITALGGWYYYATTSNSLNQLQLINEQRLATKKLLDRAQKIRYQKKEIDALLARPGEENFKIGGYFTNLINELGLRDKKDADDEISTTDEHDGYRTDTLRTILTNINMKELAILLQQLEKNPRIYLKEVDIKKSLRIPGTLDATITIATLQHLTQSSSPTAEGLA